MTCKIKDTPIKTFWSVKHNATSMRFLSKSTFCIRIDQLSGIGPLTLHSFLKLCFRNHISVFVNYWMMKFRFKSVWVLFFRYLSAFNHLKSYVVMKCVCVGTVCLCRFITSGSTLRIVHFWILGWWPCHTFWTTFLFLTPNLEQILNRFEYKLF